MARLHLEKSVPEWWSYTKLLDLNHKHYSLLFCVHPAPWQVKFLRILSAQQYLDKTHTVVCVDIVEINVLIYHMMWMLKNTEFDFETCISNGF